MHWCAFQVKTQCTSLWSGDGVANDCCGAHRSGVKTRIPPRCHLPLQAQTGCSLVPSILTSQQAGPVAPAPRPAPWPVRRTSSGLEGSALDMHRVPGPWPRSPEIFECVSSPFHGSVDRDSGTLSTLPHTTQSQMKLWGH